MAKDTAWTTAARRAIGAQLLNGPRAAYQVAAELGADPSNTARSLAWLRDERGAVTSTSGPDGPPRFELAAGQRELLLDAIGGAQPRGTLVPGQQALLVTIADGQEGTFAAELRDATKTGEVVWAARIDGAAQCVLVFDREADVYAAVRLTDALDAAGLTVRRIAVTSIMSADDLRRQAAALRLARRRR
ncbi:MAG: hypothetical protein ACR2KV_02550 [Solirubrobacteraceae bacterium]